MTIWHTLSYGWNFNQTYSTWAEITPVSQNLTIVKKLILLKQCYAWYCWSITFVCIYIHDDMSLKSYQYNSSLVGWHNTEETPRKTPVILEQNVYPRGYSKPSRQSKTRLTTIVISYIINLNSTPLKHWSFFSCT